MTSFTKLITGAAFALTLVASFTALAHGDGTPKEAQKDTLVIFQNEGITLTNPFARKAKKSQNSAAFVGVKNTGTKDVKILTATSNVAKTIELHTSFEEDGIHKMRPVKSIDVAAGSTTELKSGGYHVMLIDLVKDLEPGQTISVTLNLDNGTTLTTDYKIKGCCGHCHGPKK